MRGARRATERKPPGRERPRARERCAPRGFRRLPAIALLLVASAARAEAGGASPTEPPWDRSVRLEKAGDLRGAEAALIEAWGKRPDNYYAQLRLAYLALAAKRANAALSRYYVSSVPDHRGAP